MTRRAMRNNRRPKGSRRLDASKWLKGAWFVLLIVLALATVGSAYGGCIDPAVSAYPSVFGMMFPVFLVLTIVAIVVSMFIDKRMALIGVASIILSWGSVMDFSPMNIKSPKVTPEQREDSTFTLLSYNVLSFKMYDKRVEEPNPTLEYILEKRPDVVCLMEVPQFTVDSLKGITKQQFDTMRERYFYYTVDMNCNAIFSHYPVDIIELKGRPRTIGISAYKVDIHQVPVYVFVSHLTSIRLNYMDKDLYAKVLKGKALTDMQDIMDVKHNLGGKLMTAFKKRSGVIDTLIHYVDSVVPPGGRVIITGDFNDTQSSWALRKLYKQGFKSVYRERGFGPMITYYGNHFYFRIDHTLYRGGLDPLWMKRDRLKTSDHYPLLTEFLITNDK